MCLTATCLIAIGLNEIQLLGPSRSVLAGISCFKKKLPEAFLRECGVAQEELAFYRSMIGSDFYSCFISYSHADEAFAAKLRADLVAANVSCWFADHDMKAGRKLHSQINLALRRQDKLLLVISGASMASNWVRHEIRQARKREQTEGCQVLFPVRLVSMKAIQKWESFHADTGTDAAEEIREYFVPDFSNWTDDDAYSAALARLLSDLKKTADG